MDKRWLIMSDMVEETGMHRQTVLAALQRRELHGGQSMKRGTWRVERPCFEAWLRGDECAHRAVTAEAA